MCIIVILYFPDYLNLRKSSMSNESHNLYLAYILVNELLGKEETMMMRIVHVLAISSIGVIHKY